jgi:mRNA interferase MazF
MVIARGELWWSDLGIPDGSEPGYRRPVLVISGDQYNASRLSTVMIAVVTGATRLASRPGNVTLGSDLSGLPRESIVNVTQLYTLNRARLEERIAALPDWLMQQVDDGLRRALSLR